MPGNSLLPSVLGNAISTRQRLSAVRQRLGLEPSSPNLRELAPSPPNGPSFKRAGAGADSMQTEPDFSGFQLPDDQREAMHQMVRQHRTADGQAVVSDAEMQQAPSPVHVSQDPKLAQAFKPMADFFQANGRIPNMEELAQIRAKGQLEQDLGREATPSEVSIYRAKPPKGTEIKPPPAQKQ